MLSQDFVGYKFNFYNNVQNNYEAYFSKNSYSFIPEFLENLAEYFYLHKVHSYLFSIMKIFDYTIICFYCKRVNTLHLSHLFTK